MDKKRQNRQPGVEPDHSDGLKNPPASPLAALPALSCFNIVAYWLRQSAAALCRCRNHPMNTDDKISQTGELLAKCSLPVHGLQRILKEIFRFDIPVGTQMEACQLMTHLHLLLDVG